MAAPRGRFKGIRFGSCSPGSRRPRRFAPPETIDIGEKEPY